MTGRYKFVRADFLTAVFEAEQQCLAGPFAFPTDHTRFTYFRNPGRLPAVACYDDTRCEVVLMSGLPASGKDTWIREHASDLPVIALHELRVELDVPPNANQGTVANSARDRARALLREGRSFAWNASTRHVNCAGSSPTCSPATGRESASSTWRHRRPSLLAAIAGAANPYPTPPSKDFALASTCRTPPNRTLSKW